MNKRKLLGKSILIYIFSLLLINLLLFLPAGSLRFWEAWLFNGCIFIPMIFFLSYLYRKDPRLLERRLNYREKEKQQKILQSVGSVVYLGLFVLPGLDFRYHWSSVPLIFIILANIGFLLGYLFVMRVLIENSYASRTIQVEKEQTVISSGPYRFIRHPMYLGVLFMYLCIPLALGSYYSLLLLIPLPLHLVLRIRNEEKVLDQELKGYLEYKEKVKFRLIPYIW